MRSVAGALAALAALAAAVLAAAAQERKVCMQGGCGVIFLFAMFRATPRRAGGGGGADRGLEIRRECAPF